MSRELHLVIAKSELHFFLTCSIRRNSDSSSEMTKKICKTKKLKKLGRVEVKIAVQNVYGTFYLLRLFSLALK